MFKAANDYQMTQAKLIRAAKHPESVNKYLFYIC